MTDMRSVVAAWWVSLSEADQQRAREFADLGLPPDLAGGMVVAGILPDDGQWVSIDGHGVVFLPMAVREYLVELDHDDRAD